MTELETLEALRGDECMREVVVRMARLSRRNRLGDFARVVAADPELEPGTKAWIGALAADEPCLHAVETYLAG
ncbi:MAG TPA: hypothetical protein VH306_13285 [Gaiellaceae bacterium]|jgi:hypothetical protein